MTPLVQLTSSEAIGLIGGGEHHQDANIMDREAYSKDRQLDMDDESNPSLAAHWEGKRRRKEPAVAPTENPWAAVAWAHSPVSSYKPEGTRAIPRTERMG